MRKGNMSENIISQTKSYLNIVLIYILNFAVGKGTSHLGNNLLKTIVQGFGGKLISY